MRVPRTAAAALTLALAATGCGASDASTFDGRSLTLGYFPNITHAPALVGVGDGILADALDDVELSTQTFNSGPDAVNGLPPPGPGQAGRRAVSRVNVPVAASSPVLFDSAAGWWVPYSEAKGQGGAQAGASVPGATV